MGIRRRESNAGRSTPFALTDPFSLGETGSGEATHADGPLRASFAALAAGTRLGRYRIVRRIGSGGMGVVYEARDPELDRDVAIKLLRAESTGGKDGHARLLREAQAMARLAHPHVVSVFDVGLHDERVFLAMELIAGPTLDVWLDEETRTLPEIARVFLQAGEGLAAAHAAGLVHRDFKADNVLVDPTGGAKVMDFGLVRSHRSSLTATDGDGFDARVIGESTERIESPLTQDGVVVGTPSYMAPEQHVGRDPTPASDQYSFCAALYEAVYGTKPFRGAGLRELALAKTRLDLAPVTNARRVPAALRDAILRGLAPLPGVRYCSMNALLDDLAAAVRPRRSRRRIGLVIGGAAMAAGVVAATPSATPCPDTPRLDHVWNDEQRAEVRDAILGTDASFAPATWERVEPRIDRYAESWTTTRQAVCELADDGGSPDAALRCLDERRFALDAALAELRTPETGTLRAAVEMVSGLPEVERCRRPAGRNAAAPVDPARAQAIHAVRRGLEGVRAKREAGRYAAAMADALALHERVRALEDPSTEARVLVEVGEAQMAAARHDAGIAAWESAAWMAAGVDDDETAADAATRLVFAVAEYRQDSAGALAWARHAAAALARWDDDSEAAALAEARLRGSIAVAHSAGGRFDEALAAFVEALEVQRSLLGADNPEVAGAMENVGLTLALMGRLPEAQAQLQAALDVFRLVLGDDHPDVALVLVNLAGVVSELGDQQEAARMLSSARSIFERALGPDHPAVGRTINSLGRAAGMSGDYDAAIAYHQQALDIAEAAFGPAHHEVAMPLVGLGSASRALRRHEDARRYFERALDVARAVNGNEHDFTAGVLNDLGWTFLDLGRHADAEPLLRQGLAIRRSVLGNVHPGTASSLNTLGMMLTDKERWDEAESVHREALGILEAVYGAEHPETLATRFDLAYIELKHGDPGAAAAQMEAVASSLDSTSADPLFVADVRFHWAQAIVASGGDRAHAVVLATRARDAFTAAGEDEAAEVEAFVARYRSGKGRASRQP